MIWMILAGALPCVWMIATLALIHWKSHLARLESGRGRYKLVTLHREVA